VVSRTLSYSAIRSASQVLESLYFPAGAREKMAMQAVLITLVHIFAQPESFLSLKPAKHPTTWYKKCSR